MICAFRAEHPHENIKRIDPDFSTKKDLYCFDCVAENSNLVHSLIDQMEKYTCNNNDYAIYCTTDSGSTFGSRYDICVVSDATSGSIYFNRSCYNLQITIIWSEATIGLQRKLKSFNSKRNKNWYMTQYYFYDKQ